MISWWRSESECRQGIDPSGAEIHCHGRFNRFIPKFSGYYRSKTHEYE